MRIRRAEPSDAAAVAAIYAPHVRDGISSFEYTPPDAVEMAARIDRISANFPWLVAVEAGEVVGYAYASPHRERAAYQWSADVSAYLRNDWRGMGLGRRLYEALFPILREQGVHAVHAGITLPNDASVALHRSMGMRDIGIYRQVGFKLGAWRDVVRMGLVHEDVARAPDPITPFAQISWNAIDFEHRRPAGREMRGQGVKIIPGDFTDERVRALLARHVAGMHESSPPGTCHVLDLSGLQQDSVSFFTAWEGEALLSIGALKELSPHHGEIKSMRTSDAHLRSGAGRAMLEHLLDLARARGYRRVSLETGTGEAFEPALALYRARGFTSGDAFGDYQATAFNQFLHLDLAKPG